jgi:hypothetical protein
MKEQEISDNEIQILGLDYKTTKTGRKRRLLWLFGAGIAIAGAGIMLFILHNAKSSQAVETDSVAVQLELPSDVQPEETLLQGYIEVREETVNDVPLKIYIPRNAIPELTLTMPCEVDSSVVFVTRAADVGGNNYGIVGDFVVKGEQLARGVRKEGFCAITGQTLTLGVDAETPLLQEAISEKGYFFRQYPLVKNLQAIDNKPKGKSIRRALAIRDGEIMMLESASRESFHDFAQALADAGVSEAIYLVGGNSYGWYRDEQDKQVFFGTKQEKLLYEENYLVWKIR